jgi:hypothetical protein
VKNITKRGEKQTCYIVMLPAIAKGKKVPLCAVFKWKMMAEEKSHQRITVQVQVQESGWMAEYLVEDWIKSV